MSVDPVSLARSLVDIDSTTGREAEAGAALARVPSATAAIRSPSSRSRTAGSTSSPGSTRRPRSSSRPISTACRRSFRAARSAGCCSAAAPATRRAFWRRRSRPPSRLRAAGETRIALLFVVGEERGSDGARVANEHAPDGVRFLINGEPTDNRLGAATRGILRVRLHADGRAAHSSFPELGESAIDKLLDALMVLRGVALPDDPLLGRTHYTVGLIEGGVAPNVVSPHASAELMFRTVGERYSRARRATRGREPGHRRARARYSGRADAHASRVRHSRVSVHDRRAAADPLGSRRFWSGPAPSTWRIPTKSTSPSTR